MVLTTVLSHGAPASRDVCLRPVPRGISPDPPSDCGTRNGCAATKRFFSQRQMTTQTTCFLKWKIATNKRP